MESVNELILNIQSCLNNTLHILEDESQEVDYAVVQIESCVAAIGLVYESGVRMDLFDSVTQKLEDTANLLIASEENVRTSSRGRPKFIVPKEKLEFLLSMRFKVPDISKMLGVSKDTIFRRFREYGLSVSQTYTMITEENLQHVVRQQLLSHPNTGYKRMKGFLAALSIRVTDQRVRMVMREVDETGVYERTKNARVIVRREYYVPYFNFIWHIDANLKLIRWKIVVRCGIDGKTRLATYIKATGDNKADTHFEAFMTGVEKYGIPLRCRTDKGMENIKIAQFMIENRGSGRGSHIVGKSTHNQRIERYWKDVFFGVLGFYYNVFMCLEDDQILNVDDQRHMYILHRVFLPRLNRSLETFVDSWNLHPLSTVSNYTPAQLMLIHLPPPEFDMPVPTRVMEDDLFINNVEDIAGIMRGEESITNPSPINNCLTHEQNQHVNSIDPLRESSYFGYDLFVEAIQCLQ